MTTEVTHPPTDREVLLLLEQREWMKGMLERLVELNDNVERLIEKLPPQPAAKGGKDV